MAKISLRQPQLQDDALQTVIDLDDFLELLETAAYEESAIENYLVRGLTLPELDCHGISFHNVRFISCRFIACQFTTASFRQTALENCDLSNCDFSHSYWDCCTLREIKGTGSLWQESSLHHLLLEQCQLRYANFSGSLLEAVQFQQCSLQEASLSSCKHKQCLWDNCDCTRVDFFRTMLKNADLSTCQIDGILLSDDYTELQGLTVSSLQAVGLAKLLGINVKP